MPFRVELESSVELAGECVDTVFVSKKQWHYNINNTVWCDISGEATGEIWNLSLFENPIAHRVPICECKFCTKAQLHRILQKSPIRLRSLTKPALSFFYMSDMLNYPYLNKWPFLTAFKTTNWGMPRPMIKNIPFSRRINGSPYVSYCRARTVADMPRLSPIGL